MQFHILDENQTDILQGRKDLLLYVHIPFCVRKCDYCDFLSGPVGELEREQYVHALCKEIALHKDMAKSYVIRSIFFGGGTPSILKEEQITKIMRTIRRTFLIDEDAEITIECNPGTVTKEKARCYRRLGINRISIGLQSTQNYELKSIGRIHTYDEFLDSYYIFRECGFSNINIDLMSALPGQSLDSYKETLDRVIHLEPEHISAYSLILEEGTRLYDRVLAEKKKGISSLPDEETERVMDLVTREKLEDAGYKRYEISNYAKSGYHCRHNIGYWKRTPYLGVGIGAASLIEESRFNKIRDREEYVSRLEKNHLVLNDVCEEITPLTVEEQMEETMFLGLRMIEGIQKATFLENFHVPVEEVYGKALQKLEIEALLEQDDKSIWLTETGLDVSNQVLAEFLF